MISSLLYVALHVAIAAEGVVRLRIDPVAYRSSTIQGFAFEPLYGSSNNQLSNLLPVYMHFASDGQFQSAYFKCPCKYMTI